MRTIAANRPRILRMAALLFAAAIVLTSSPVTAHAKAKYKWVCLGKFKIVYYTGDSITASGKKTKANHTIAVDTDVISLGTKVKLGTKKAKKTYVAEDTGGSIQGNVIDVYVKKASQIPKCGVKYKKVWVRVKV